MQEMQEMWVRSLGQEDPLEEGMSLQYSCLENPTHRGAWVQSMGSQRAGHDWSEWARVCTGPGPLCGSIARWKRDPGEDSPQSEQVWLLKHWKWGQGARLPWPKWWSSFGGRKRTKISRFLTTEAIPLALLSTITPLLFWFYPLPLHIHFPRTSEKEFHFLAVETCFWAWLLEAQNYIVKVVWALKRK